jgi:hypothetical protein
VSFQRQGDAFLAWIVNDLSAGQDGELEIGFADLVDPRRVCETSDVAIPANASVLGARLELPSEVRVAPERFVAYALLRVGDVTRSRARATLVYHEYNRLQIPLPQVEVTRDGEAITLRAQTYVFQLQVETVGGKASVPSDNWFDILPGEVRTVHVPEAGARDITCWAFTQARTDPNRIHVATLPANQEVSREEARS